MNVRSEETKQAYAILEKHKKLQLRQQRQFIEALTGFEKNNRYALKDAEGNNVFFVQEGSSCLERLCVLGECKAWRMDIYIVGAQGIEGGVGSMTKFMHLERACKPTFYCLNRPEVVVTDSQTGMKIGTIREPWTCMNLRFDVLNADDQPALKVEACACSPGLLCPSPCDGCPCQLIDFPITDMATGATVASIQKKWRWGDMGGIFAFCAKEWDDYWIEFGDAANPDFKMLFLATSLFIQMRFFDKRNQNGQK